jgi:hypothetical protein
MVVFFSEIFAVVVVKEEQALWEFLSDPQGRLPLAALR